MSNRSGLKMDIELVLHNFGDTPLTSCGDQAKIALFLARQVAFALILGEVGGHLSGFLEVFRYYLDFLLLCFLGDE